MKGQRVKGLKGEGAGEGWKVTVEVKRRKVNVKGNGEGWSLKVDGEGRFVLFGPLASLESTEASVVPNNMRQGKRPPRLGQNTYSHGHSDYYSYSYS